MATEQSGNEVRPEKPAITASSEAIDIQSLADRVYRLMVRDVRLAQARGAAVSRREE